MEHVQTYDELKERKIYCLHCADWIAGSEIKLVTNDAEQVEFLCPGCDWSLVWPVNRFEFYGLSDGAEEIDQ